MIFISDNKGLGNYIKLLLNIIFLLIDVEEVRFETTESLKLEIIF